jgi:GDP-L-fucose synthase
MVDGSGVLLGASGLAGSGIERALQRLDLHFEKPGREEVDLLCESKVKQYLLEKKPEFIIMAAGAVGGIHENLSKQSYFLITNFEINKNVLQAAHNLKIQNVLMLASSCIYPVDANQPLREEDFYHGAPEPTNLGHAIGKKAACWLLQHYREFSNLNWTTVISSSLYGVEDNFSGTGHVIPALLNRFNEAIKKNRTIEPIWGEPTTSREFLFNDDLGEAIGVLLKTSNRPPLVNVGSGEVITLGSLAELIAHKYGYVDQILFEGSKPSGWPRRELESGKITEYGWRPKTSLSDGLDIVIKSRN